MRPYSYLLLFLLPTTFALQAQNVLLEENFDACTLPSTWTTNVVGSGPATWYVGYPQNDDSDGSTIDGGCMMVIDDDAAGNNTPPWTLQLISPEFDATQNSTVRMSVDVHFRQYAESSFKIYVYDGTQYVELVNYQHQDYSGPQFSQYVTYTADLSFYANPHMRIMFEYDDGDTWAWWAGFDNLKVEGIGTATNLVLEDFNDCALPAGWSTEVISGVNDWQFGFFTNSNAYAANSMNGSCFAFFDDDGIGQSAPFSKVRLKSPVFNGTQFANIKMDYDFIFRRYADLENVAIYVSDGVQEYPAVTYFTILGEQLNEYVHESIDLSAFRSETMQIIIQYDDGNDWDWWVGIDNIKIYGEGSLNDLCQNAIDLSAGAPCLSGNNRNAVFQGAQPSCSDHNVGGLWYHYHANETGIVKIKTQAKFNDAVTVYTGGCGALTEVACSNWDEYGFIGENLFMQTTAGQDYLIRVSGQQSDFGLSRGDFCISLESVSAFPTPPTNDNCQNAVLLTISNSNCVSGNNYHANTNGPAPTRNLKSRADIWYRFVANTAAELEISTEADFADVITLYSGNCNNLVEIASNENGRTLRTSGLTPGQTYRIQVSGFFATLEGNVCMRIKPVNETPPANDNCISATNVVVGAACTPGTTIGATFQGTAPGCEPDPTSNIWFTFTAPASGSVKINTGANFVHTLSVYEGPCSDLQEIFCKKNPLRCNGFVVINSLVPGQLYYLQIASASTPAGHEEGDVCIRIIDGNQPDDFNPLSLSVSADCGDQGSGQLQIEASGGLGNYSFEGNTSSDILYTGDSYLVVVSDEMGCQQSQAGVLECGAVNCTLQATISSQQITCANANNGIATAESTGGSGVLSYHWSNGSSASSISSLHPGNYGVTITDENGCIVNAVTNIYEPPMLIANASASGQTTYGVNNGAVSATPSGGTQPYVYTWSSGSNSQNISGLAPGDYTVTITDANNCENIETVTVESLVCTLSATVSKTNVSCYGLNNGTATANLTGGNAPFSYEWSNGATTSSVSGLSPGPYHVTVTDANQCPAVRNFNITSPSLLTATTTSTGETANGAHDGTASVVPGGGTPAYSYHWSNGGTGASISNLAPGVYSVTVTDQHGCVTIMNANVNAFNCVLSSTINTTDVSCFGGNNGQVSISISGGTEPFTYQWSNSGSGATQSNLPAGNYTITVTDASNCLYVADASVSQPNPLNLQISGITPTDCADNPAGAATVAASGGNNPYEYAWSGGQSGPSVSGLTDGAYTVTATDDNGCTTEVNLTIEVVDNELPTVLTQNVVLYLDANGQATLSADQVNAGSTDNCGISQMGLSQTQFDCSQTGNQSVQLIVVDVNGHIGAASANIEVIDNQHPELICPDDILATNCDGVVNYALPTVSDNCGAPNPALISGLASGSIFPPGQTNISYIAQDASGNTGVCSFTVTLTNTLSASFDVEKPDCPGAETGSIIAHPSGGASPYTLQWGNGQSGETLSNLAPGTYDVTVYDSQSCQYVSTVLVPDVPAFQYALNSITDETDPGNNGAIDVSFSGGTQPYTYEWYLNGNLVGATEDLSNIPGGDYELHLSDANGCTYPTQFLTVESFVDTRDLPAGWVLDLYPNPSDGKFFLDITLPSPGTLGILVYDIAGQELYRRNSEPLQVKHYTFDFSHYPAGVYAMKLSFGDGTILIKKIIIF